MRYLGLPPAAYSTGERRRQGGSTTAGTTQARRAMIAGAWAYRDPATVSRHRHLRLEQVPKPIQDMRGQAQGRLGQRYRPLIARGNHANQVVVAMARARRAFRWAMAQEGPLPPEIEPLQRPPSMAHSFARASAETLPRFCATLDSVQRLKQTLVPRSRQAPDGRK